MVDIKRFILHVVKTDESNPNKIIKKKEINITPKNNENVLRMKQDIAKILVRERGKDEWNYWYVVCETERPEGGPGFRTVIGKTFF